MSLFFPSKKPQPAPHLPSPHSLFHPSQHPTHNPQCDGCFQGPTFLALTRPMCAGSARLPTGRGVTGCPVSSLDPAVGLCFLRGHTSDLWHSCAGVPPTICPPRSVAEDLVPFPFIWVPSLGVPSSSAFLGQPRF